MQRFKIVLLILFFFVSTNVLKAEELESSQIPFPVVGQTSYNIQKYTGFNFFTHTLAEGILKVSIKLKTRAKKISTDLEIFSGWDLFRKKIKSLNIDAEKLTVKGVPIEKFELLIKDPLYFKKKRVAFPVNLKSTVKVNLEDITEVINNLPKWKKVLGELELPVPPFGTTKVKIDDLKIKINETGFTEVFVMLTSLEAPDSEPIKMSFTGNLVLRDKKIIVSDLKGEAEDIFTGDSDLGRSFSEFLEDLINPVFDFHKYEKNGLTIDNVYLSFGVNSLALEINARLLPR